MNPNSNNGGSPESTTNNSGPKSKLNAAPSPVKLSPFAREFVPQSVQTQNPFRSAVLKVLTNLVDTLKMQPGSFDSCARDVVEFLQANLRDLDVLGVTVSFLLEQVFARSQDFKGI